MKRDESYGILVLDKIFIFSLFVGFFYHKGPALRTRLNTKCNSGIPVDELFRAV